MCFGSKNEMSLTLIVNEWKTGITKRHKQTEFDANAAVKNQFTVEK